MNGSMDEWNAGPGRHAAQARRLDERRGHVQVLGVGVRASEQRPASDPIHSYRRTSVAVSQPASHSSIGRTRSFVR